MSPSRCQPLLHRGLLRLPRAMAESHRLGGGRRTLSASLGRPRGALPRGAAGLAPPCLPLCVGVPRGLAGRRRVAGGGRSWLAGGVPLLPFRVVAWRARLPGRRAPRRRAVFLLPCPLVVSAALARVAGRRGRLGAARRRRPGSAAWVSPAALLSPVLVVLRVRVVLLGCVAVRVVLLAGVRPRSVVGAAAAWVARRRPVFVLCVGRLGGRRQRVSVAVGKADGAELVKVFLFNLFNRYYLKVYTLYLEDKDTGGGVNEWAGVRLGVRVRVGGVRLVAVLFPLPLPPRVTPRWRLRLQAGLPPPGGQRAAGWQRCSAVSTTTPTLPCHPPWRTAPAGRRRRAGGTPAPLVVAVLLPVRVVRRRLGLPLRRAASVVPLVAVRGGLPGGVPGVLAWVVLCVLAGVRGALPPTLMPVPPQPRRSFAVSAAAPPTPPPSRQCTSRGCPETSVSTACARCWRTSRGSTPTILWTSTGSAPPPL